MTPDDLIAHIKKENQVCAFLDGFGRQVALVHGTKESGGPFEIPTQYGFEGYECFQPTKRAVDEYGEELNKTIPDGPMLIVITYTVWYSGCCEAEVVEFPVDWIGDAWHLAAKAKVAKEALHKEEMERAARKTADEERRERAEYERLKARFE